MRKKRITRQDYLDAIVQSLRRPEHGDIGIEFVPFRGWVIRGEPRWLGDDGADDMGPNWHEAEAAIREYFK